MLAATPERLLHALAAPRDTFRDLRDPPRDPAVSLSQTSFFILTTVDTRFALALTAELDMLLNLWRVLPEDDSIRAQQLLCDALLQDAGLRS